MEPKRIEETVQMLGATESGLSLMKKIADIIVVLLVVTVNLLSLLRLMNCNALA